MSPATVELKVPPLAESIADAVLAEWLKPDGASVQADEPVATLETDKAAVEIAAPESGALRHARAIGDRVVPGDVLARIEPSAEAATGKAASAPPATRPGPEAKPEKRPAATPARGATAAPPPPVTTGESQREGARAPDPPATTAAAPSAAAATSYGPAVRRLLEERGLDPAQIEGTGLGGRILREDVLRHIERRAASPEAPAAPAVSDAPAPRAPAPPPPTPRTDEARGERIVPMSRIRRRIAERLVQAQHTAAILTTFNEIDMSAVLDARARYRESFERTHGVRLGFMSFFARACVLALHELPELNAEIRGSDIVYHDAVHMGVAVQTDRGLVVPVVRDADRLGFAEIEREIARLAERARTNTLSLEELLGGTFTISNGGVYGSLLSTPILNPPQSGILGMHKIEKRPIVIDDAVQVRPMMYVALSYDHRIVDGEQAVTFLVRVKERLEAPARMLLEV